MKNSLFESQWSKAKEALLEGEDLTKNFDGSHNSAKKRTMEIVLENARKKLMENATSGATNAAQVATLNKVILPIIRRVMPTVIANEIIGVQPMTGPVAQIHTMRVRYADTVPTDGSGVTAGTEALSPFEIAKYYSGNGDATNPKAANTAALEGTMGKRLSVQILKEVVEAESRKLSARWTFESEQDAQSQHGLDLENEIMAAVAQEITTEIDQEIIGNLRALPGAATAANTFDMSALSGQATFVGDQHAALAILINRQANLIAARTRRGAANWAVVSPTALTILQSATTSAFARSTEGTFDAPTNTKFVGLLNNSLRIYSDTYASDATPVLVGYKGSDMDAAAFYCPYIPLMSSGTVMDPNTGELVSMFQTRYGYVELTNTASSLGNAADYLGTVAINTANLKFY